MFLTIAKNINDKFFDSIIILKIGKTNIAEKGSTKNKKHQ